MTPVHPAQVAALLFAVDPAGLGGVVLRCGASAARDDWLALLQRLLPAGMPWRRVPLHISAERLHGGLDLAATLKAGRPVVQRGLLDETAGGVLLLAMAERLAPATAATIAAAIDGAGLTGEKHGLGIGVVALDEGQDSDERPPASLRDRLAFELTELAIDAAAAPDGDRIAAARQRLAGVQLPDDVVEALVAASLVLGVASARALLQACSAARALAALDGRSAVSAADAATAAGLVLGPRSTQLPASSAEADDQPAAADTAEPQQAAGEPPAPASAEPPQPETQPQPPGEGKGDADGEGDRSPQAVPEAALDDVVLQAALAALPRGLLTALALGRSAAARRSGDAGRAGAAQAGNRRGRPLGGRRADGRSATRLNLVETLRAAAPWQPLRRRDNPDSPLCVQVHREDFRVWRFRQRSQTTTVFVVDASGSAALHRLAETKGAVELLLADCYVRRDSVAVIAFRGAGAEVLLPPTRSLARAKRSLAGLPGGGGTPLAAGIAAAITLADSVRRRGATPVLVLLTDGRANIASDGTPGRGRAGDDALTAARQVLLQGVTALLIDTAPQAQEPARRLAEAMGARYLPLPHAGAELLSQAVRAAGGS